MSRDDSGVPRLVTGDGAVALVPVAQDDRGITESRLQELLDRHPDLLPIDEIGRAWGPLVSLGREVRLPVGFIDNLFVSPTGEVTVVEAKLWRNPQARREVIGQIIDYAAALADMSYEDLDQAVIDALPLDARPIWQRVLEAGHPAASADVEPGFIDTVSRNLAEGRFLLLVVGDGIRSDLQSIASLIGHHPNLGFHLELVELRLFRLPDGGSLFVVPRIVGRTAEVQRATVSVNQDGLGAVSVVVEAPSVEAPATTGRISSLEDFSARSAVATSPQQAAAIASIAEWWGSTRGGKIKFHKTSVNLSSPYRHCSAKVISVATLYVDGLIQGSVAPMAKWRGIISQEEALERYRAAGFTGDPEWPTFQGDPADPHERARIEALLTWADELIRAADRTGPPSDRADGPALPTSEPVDDP